MTDTSLSWTPDPSAGYRPGPATGRHGHSGADLDSGSVPVSALIPLIQYGTVTLTFAAADSATGGVTYPIPYSAVPVVLTTVLIGSNLDVLVNLQGNIVTGFTWRAFQKSGTPITATGTMYWLAIGTR